jgi:hypothetical protein
MFFLFPFVAERADAPASQRAPQYKRLPLLPQPQSACAQTRLESGRQLRFRRLEALPSIS